MRSQWGAWVFDPDALTLDFTGKPYSRNDPYWIDLDRCDSPEEVCDWIFQILKKEWGTPKVIHDLLRALDDLLHPQAYLCSFGRRRVISNVRAHIEKTNKERRQLPLEQRDER